MTTCNVLTCTCVPIDIRKECIRYNLNLNKETDWAYTKYTTFYIFQFFTII